jgi:MFS superfamily sulfate permease-like transporter
MLPFFGTFLALVFTVLLTGVLVGLAVGVFFVLRAHVSTPFSIKPRSSNDRAIEKGPALREEGGRLTSGPFNASDLARRNRWAPLEAIRAVAGQPTC